MKRSMLFALSLGIWALLPGALFAAGKPNPNSCGTDVPNVSVTIDSGSGYKITLTLTCHTSTLRASAIRFLWGFRLATAAMT